MSTFSMWDSVDTSPLRAADCDALAGYVNGKWPTFAAIRTFGKPALSIAVTSGANAQALDVEQYDATPADVPGWLDRQRARGVTNPVIYCSASVARSVLTAAAGRHFLLWSAHWTSLHICGPSMCGYPQASATQWASHGPAGQNVDQSVISQEFYQAIGGHVAGPKPVPPPRPQPGVYVVRSGDSLSSIAARYGTTWQAIYAANRKVIGGDPDVIHPGQRLVIPHAPKPSSRTYTVKAGDSLDSIAQRFHTTWQKIYTANRAVIGSNPDLIHPGQVLRIPS